MATKKELIKKAEDLGLDVKSYMTKADVQNLIDSVSIEVETHINTDIPGEVQTVTKIVEPSTKVTLLGSGPLSGEYRFAEIPGSIAAKSVEEAIRKAEEIVDKHPNLLN